MASESPESMTTPQITDMQVRTYDVIGTELYPFAQGMANRLGVGAARYGREERDQADGDMIATAHLRLVAAAETGNRECLIDAANFCFLAYRRLPDSPPFDGHSPGYVGDGDVIVRARGRWAHLNGTKFEMGGSLLTQEESDFALLAPHGDGKVLRELLAARRRGVKK